MMQSPLLNFNELVQLAQQDPQALEALRQQVCQQLIASARPADQRKLKGLQFKIDMERRRAKSQTIVCTQLYDRMNSSFAQLKALLSHTQAMLPHQSSAQPAPAPTAESTTQHSAHIIPFPTH